MILSQSSRAGRLLYTVLSKERFQAVSSLTAVIKSSVTKTDKLNMRSRPGSCLASINPSISGWSQRITAIMAPRRDPALMIVRHIESQTSIKERGPEASAPTPFTGEPFGRRVEKLYPIPPPCCMVSAASLSAKNMPDISSGILPITKQLNKVTLRSVPAPEMIRPAGKKQKSVKAL